jgi:hypothetical protein
VFGELRRRLLIETDRHVATYLLDRLARFRRWDPWEWRRDDESHSVTGCNIVRSLTSCLRTVFFLVLDGRRLPSKSMYPDGRLHTTQAGDTART